MAAAPGPQALDAWITDDFTNEQIAIRRDFIQRVYGMPNGDAAKYYHFFNTFRERLDIYLAAAAHNQRMMYSNQFFELIERLKIAHNGLASPSFEQIATSLRALWHPPLAPPTDITIEYAIWLGLWTWLQITALATTFGGVTLDLQDAGQIVHPWEKNKSLRELTRSDLPVRYDQGVPVPQNQQPHEFSTRFNIRSLQRSGIHFLTTANLLDHLRVSRDCPRKFEMTVFIFHNRPILFAMLKGRNGTPRWYRDVAQETLNTLHLLAPYDVPRCMDEFASLFGIDLYEQMNDHDPQGPPQYVTPLLDETAVVPNAGQPGTREYLTRSLQNYPYWGARLLELKDIARGQNPSTFNAWSADQQDRRVEWVTWLAFFLGIVVLVFSIFAALQGKYSVDQAKRANVYASLASVAGDQGAALTSSFLGNLSCYASCPPRLTDSTATTTSAVSVRTTRFVTVTVTTLVTVTVTTSVNVSITAGRAK